MSFQGHIENGVVVFDEPAAIAEGTSVCVEASPCREKRSPSGSRTSSASASICRRISRRTTIITCMERPNNEPGFRRYLLLVGPD